MVRTNLANCNDPTMVLDYTFCLNYRTYNEYPVHLHSKTYKKHS